MKVKALIGKSMLAGISVVEKVTTPVARKIDDHKSYKAAKNQMKQDFIQVGRALRTLQAEEAQDDNETTPVTLVRGSF